VRFIEKRGDQWDLHCRIHLFIGVLSVERVRFPSPIPHFSTLQSERFTASEQWEFYSYNGFSGYFQFSLKISVEKIV
jgi:hypothetical protein